MKFQILKKWQWLVVGGGYLFTVGMEYLGAYLSPESPSAVYQDMFPITQVLMLRLFSALLEPMFAIFWGSMLIVSLIRWIRYRRNKI